MPKTPGENLRQAIAELWADERLLDEPSARLVLWMHALMDEDNDDNPLLDIEREGAAPLPGLITKVAKARDRAEKVNKKPGARRSWRARGCPFDPAYMPTSPLLERQGQPRRPDATDTHHVALLWPFSRFFVELRRALATGASVSDPPWSHRLNEVAVMVLLSNATENGIAHEVLEKLSQRVRADSDEVLDSDAMNVALQAWLRRRRPVRTYKPGARSEEEVFRRAYRYIRRALLVGYHQAKRARSEIPRSTLQRWTAAGHVIRTADVESVRADMERRMKHEGDHPSEAKVAEMLGCSRSTVQKYRKEAESRSGVLVVKGARALGYPPEVVKALRELMAPPAPTPRVIKRRR